MPLTLTFEFDDASYLYHTGMDSALFRDEDQAGRFDYAGKQDQEVSMPDMLLALDTYDNGSLLWCASAGDALLLKKIHEAEGHTATILHDKYANGPDEEYAVLTSWDLRTGEVPLTEAPVVAELVLYGEEDASLEDFQATAVSIINEVGEVMGEPNVEDHGHHFHMSIVFKAPGVAIRDVVGSTAKAVDGAVGYSIIAEA